MGNWPVRSVAMSSMMAEKTRYVPRLGASEVGWRSRVVILGVG
jgi:hypothetical protein